jgi:hypothetical protein
MNAPALESFRDELLDRLDVLDWPALDVPPLGRMTPAAWIAAVEAGTPRELVGIARAIVQACSRCAGCPRRS